jgi:hypothetical protein
LNLILILKELRHRRLLVAASIFASAAISVMAIFQVTLSPPSIGKRSQVEAQGQIEILVDSARSPIADARRDLEGLEARAGVFAEYIAGGNVIRQIARRSDIPAKRIDVAGAAPLPGQAPGIEGSAPQLNPYGISIVQSGELPILTVLTRAPTLSKARAMAAAAPGALRRVVESIQDEQGTPSSRRVEFRVLGPAEAALVDDALGKKVALLLFIVLLGISLLGILGLPRLIAAWRDAEPVAEAGFGQRDAGAAPDVVHLPADRGGADPEAGEGAATWIGQRREP